MNSTDTIQVLVERGGLADSEWHGEKLEMKSSDQHAEEQWAAHEYESEATDKQDVGYSRFEIQIDDQESNRKNSFKSNNVYGLSVVTNQ
jgi:hypothetical protein